MSEKLEVDFLGIEDIYDDKSVSPNNSLDSSLELDDEPDNIKDNTEDNDIKELEDVKLDIQAPEDGDNKPDSNTSEETVEDDIPLVKELSEKLGFEFEEEFEDSVEGIVELSKRAAEKFAEQELDSIFNEYPEVKQLLEYMSMGGDPTKYMNTVFPEMDYNTVELTDDERQHEGLVRQELMLKGYSQEDIQAEIEDYKAGGILENKAKRALANLKKHQVAEKQNILKSQKEEYENQQREIETFWNGVNDTISKASQFKGLNIPEAEKKAFFEYLSKPVKDSKSQRDLDVEAADMETRLAIDYLLMKKFNLSNLITNKAKTLQAKSLKDRLQRSKVSSAPTSRTRDEELLSL
jgi:hypothetical protein